MVSEMVKRERPRMDYKTRSTPLLVAPRRRSLTAPPLSLHRLYQASALEASAAAHRDPWVSDDL
jgi:hypothetical protein